MIGIGHLEPVYQGNKYEIMEIEDCARSLGFSDVPGFKSKLESLTGKLIKVTKDGFFILELCDGTYDEIYGINAWLSWENKFPPGISTKDSVVKGQLLVSAFSSAYNLCNVGVKTFKEMLRTLDMIEDKCGNYDSEYYINNWYHAALMETL
jgi:hypothetical protein